MTRRDKVGLFACIVIVLMLFILAACEPKYGGKSWEKDVSYDFTG